jgi:hypothetical protein
MAFIPKWSKSCERSTLFGRTNKRVAMDELPPFPIILAIDPSMTSLGWACFNMNLGADRYDISSEAWRFGCVHPRSRECAAQFKWWDVFAQLRDRLDDWRPTHFAAEWPAFFGSSDRGRIAAQTGVTIDLGGMVGYLAGRFEIPPEFITLWTPQRWKGNAPKGATEAKFLRLYGPGARSVVRNFSDDVVDAIMIADFWLMLYFREQFAWIQRWKNNPRRGYDEDQRRSRTERPPASNARILPEAEHLH